MTTYVIRVPGGTPAGAAYLDIETTKVPTPEGFTLPSGEPLRRRWRITLAGIARDGLICLGQFEDEKEQLEWMGAILSGRFDNSPPITEVRYAATREFDEMICRGRFTNARRAHLPAPAFPAVPGAEELPWRNVYRDVAHRYEGRLTVHHPDRDWASENAATGGAFLVHNLRDVAELVFWDRRTSLEALPWLGHILMNFDDAERQILASRVR